MFRAILSPLSGALDCVHSLWYNTPTMLPAGSIVGAFIWFINVAEDRVCFNRWFICLAFVII